jgi:hypothetical protein
MELVKTYPQLPNKDTGDCKQTFVITINESDFRDKIGRDIKDYKEFNRFCNEVYYKLANLVEGDILFFDTINRWRR